MDCGGHDGLAGGRGFLGARVWLGRADGALADGGGGGRGAAAQLGEVVAVRRAPTAGARAKLGRALHRRLPQLQPLGFIASDARAGLARSTVGGIDRGAGLAARFLWRARGRAR